MTADELTPDDDELGARLGGALTRHAERTTPTVPPASSIRAAARREDRNRRLQLGALVMAAAVIVTALVLVRRGDDDAAYYGTVPYPTDTAAVPEPLHLVLDSPDVAMFSAVESHPTSSGFPPGTTPGPEGRSETEVIVYSAPDRALDLPRLIVAVRTTENPTGPWGAPAANERPTTVGGRPANVRDTSAGPTLVLKWDGTHEVAASFQGLDEATASSALATLGQDDGGRWSLATPPPGLEEVGRVNPDAAPVTGWYSDATVYQDATPQPIGSTSVGLHRLTVTRVAAGVRDDDLLAWALQAGQGPAPTIERTTVRGNPALVVAPAADAPQAAYTYAWFERDHRVVVRLAIDTRDRARADQLVASLRELGPQEWADTITACTAVAVNGTIALAPEGRAGGSCPL